jgi:hypothetical protein
MFEAFWSKMSAEVEFDNGVKAVIKDCMKTAGFDVTSGSISHSVPTPTSKKKSTKEPIAKEKVPSSWIMYLREKTEEMKADSSMTGSERRKRIGEMWKALGKDGQKSWSQGRG